MAPSRESYRPFPVSTPCSPGGRPSGGRAEIVSWGQQLADVLDGDGEGDAIGLERRADDDADHGPLVVEQRAAGVSGIDRRLRLDGRGDPRDSVVIAPLIVRTDLGDDALGER